MFRIFQPTQLKQTAMVSLCGEAILEAEGSQFQ